MSAGNFVTVVIVVGSRQVSEDTFITDRFSRNFSTSRSIDDMLSWAESMGVVRPTINDLKFYDYTGGSV